MSEETNDETVELEVIVLEDEEGKEHAYVVLSVDMIDGQTYALLATEESYDDESNDMLELDIFQYDEDEDEEASVFAAIDDDATYEKVKAFFTNLLEAEVTDAPQ